MWSVWNNDRDVMQVVENLNREVDILWHTRTDKANDESNSVSVCWRKTGNRICRPPLLLIDAVLTLPFALLTNEAFRFLTDVVFH